MNSNAVDLAAKLLANEDINVVRAPVSTASFDIKSRVLTLPMWKELTPEIEQMLVGHEVGHALYTTDEYSDTIKENPAIKSYLNVIEDVRIEKLIKRKYPGIRKYMAAGYKQLNDRDFFEVDGKNMNKLLLIDRINLYFKSTAMIDFNPEEKRFLVRAERTESVQDVIDLANEVFIYAKAEHEKKMEEVQEELEKLALEDAQNDDEGDYDYEESEDYDDYFDDTAENTEESEDGKPSASDDDAEEGENDDPFINSAAPNPELNGQPSADISSKTMKAFEDNLAELADTDTVYQYWKYDTFSGTDVIVPFKKILEHGYENIVRFRENYPEQNQKLREEFVAFKRDTQKEVNYLVKEFEMRKSATAYKRTQTAKSGQIDMKKIYGYQIKDDLFKRIQITQEGKKHGMIIYVDWSGSMSDVMHDTIKQVINLSLFCTRTNIPYRVYAFTNAYRDELKMEGVAAEREHWNGVQQTGENVIAANQFNLLELFSDKMTSSDFYKMAELLMDYRFFWIRRFVLGSTPLNEALLWMHENMGSFISKNNVEKMTFITLTDGEGHGLNAASGRFTERELLEDAYTVDDKYVPAKWKTVKNFIRDDVTKKTYSIENNNNQQTRKILQMIKDRYQCRNVGFYICPNRQRDIYWALRSNTKIDGSRIYNEIADVRVGFRTDGFYSVKGAGRDELFIIGQHKMKINDGELEATGEMTARKLASQFGKYLNQKKTSRVLLNRFVGYVA